MTQVSNSSTASALAAAPVPASPRADALGSEGQSRGILLPSGRFFFRYRDFLSPLVFITIVLAFRPVLTMGNASVDLAADVLGILVVAAGQILRAAVIGFAYIKRGGKGKRVYADRLVQEGFFAHARNPLYVGNFLIFVGLFIIHGSPWAVVIGIGFYAFLYRAIVAAEEHYLEEKFGDAYRDYCRRVNRFVLSFRGLSASLKGMTYDWHRLIRKEYGTVFSTMIALLGVIAWEEYVLRGTHARSAVFVSMSAVAFITLVAYVLARVGKKTGRLGAD